MADLEIHLRRRRFIEQAQAHRPRLPGNLRQLGARGLVTNPVAPQGQAVLVKVNVTQAATTGAHLRYLEGAHKGRDGHAATLYGPGAEDRRAFLQAAAQDPRQFRLVVSTPDHPRLDRTALIASLMAQMARDLRMPLSWIAANHYDTAHPHTHVALRGADLTGAPVVLSKHYFLQGLRNRAQALLHALLEPQGASKTVPTMERDTGVAALARLRIALRQLTHGHDQGMER